MIAKPFFAPSLKVARARKHIADFTDEVADYLRHDPMVVFLYRDKKDGNHLLCWRSREEIPDNLSIIFGDAVHNLRTALDVMTNDLVALNGIDPKNVYFPFASSSSKIDRQIKDKMRGASQDVIDLMLTLKPYRGGNDALRAIHDLDIRDKHITLIDARLTLESPLMPLRPVKHERRGQRGKVKFKVDFAELPTTPIDMTGFAVDPDMEVIGKVDGSKAYITIADGLPLEGEPAVETLNQLADLVEGIIQTFETHCLGGKTV